MIKKKTQHPEMREVNVVMVDGSIKVIKMVYSKPELLLEVDQTTHRAWQKTKKFFRSSNAEKMRTRFGGDIRI